MENKVSNTQDIFIEIVNELYPAIEKNFSSLKQSDGWKENEELKENVKDLEREFNSLAYYEKKLVFPSLMDKINHENSALAFTERKQNFSFCKQHRKNNFFYRNKRKKRTHRIDRFVPKFF